MTGPTYRDSYSQNAAENYERYFVPSIGRPVAADLVGRAALRPSERVLDVACGTGIVARLAAERVGPSGAVVGFRCHRGTVSRCERQRNVDDVRGGCSTPGSCRLGQEPAAPGVRSSARCPGHDRGPTADPTAAPSVTA